MKLNTDLIEELQGTGTKILAVTKYFDSEDTQFFMEQLEQYVPVIVGYGENRIHQIIEKEIPREKCHFIGNIQSRMIKDIVGHCSVIHSVSTKKHLQKLQETAENTKNKLSIFLQLQLDDNKKIGFSPTEIIEILSQNTQSADYEIVGISGMGKGECSIEEKKREFQLLTQIRDEYIPGGFISAGTSRDYRTAVEEGVDIVRIGQLLFE